MDTNIQIQMRKQKKQIKNNVFPKKKCEKAEKDSNNNNQQTTQKKQIKKSSTHASEQKSIDTNDNEKGKKKVKLQKSVSKGKVEEIAGMTAKAFGIYDEQLKCLIEKRQNEKRQIASLNKMMTLFCTLKLIQKYKIQMATYFRVSENAMTFMGTMAELQHQQWITVQDLLYALMLPSGNDAALVLAQNLGAFIFYDKKGQTKLLTEIKSFDVTSDGSKLRVYEQEFVRYMNQVAKQCGLLSSKFVNPHGLDNVQSFSTVKDVASLLKLLMQNQTAAKVMGTKKHKAKLKINTLKSNQCREAKWSNTNRLLLKDGFVAGKTGQTMGGGNCLASVYIHEQKKYYTVVLGCKGQEDRFRETQKIVNKYILKTD